MGRGFAGARQARLPGLRFGKGALLEMGFPFFWEYHSYVGNAPTSRLLEMHPPLLFLRARRKRRAPGTVEKKKRAFGCRLAGSRSSPLAAQVVRTLYRWCPVVTLAVLLTALRAGAGRGRGAVRSLCFCCASIAWVYRGCTAARLLCCASLFAVAAQCAGARRGRYAARCVFLYCASVVQMCRNALQQSCSVVLFFPLLLRNALCGCAVGNVLFYRIEISVLRLSQRTTPLQQPSAPRSGSERRRAIFPLFCTRPFAKRHR